MTKEQAIAIIKQPDRIGCNLIKANDEESCKFNQESIEALNMAIEALEQQPSEEQVRILNCENIDIQKFTEAMKCQPLQVVNHLSEQVIQPCDDCVSREQALLQLTGVNLSDKTTEELIKLFGGRIQSLPPVTPTQRWIPVSERVPEDRNIVLVTAYWHETYQVMMASYFGEGLWWCVPFNNCGDHMQKLNPKAWQPLPKPYEEKRGNENE